MYKKGNSVQYNNISYECVGFKGVSGTVEPDWRNEINYAIVGIDTTNNLIIVQGNQVSKFLVGDVVKINGSNHNDGYYTIVSSTYSSSASQTSIKMVETIKYGDVSGNIYPEDLLTRDGEILWSVFTPSSVITYDWNKYLDIAINLTLE